MHFTKPFQELFEILPLALFQPVTLEALEAQ